VHTSIVADVMRGVPHQLSGSVPPPAALLAAALHNQMAFGGAGGLLPHTLAMAAAAAANGSMSDGGLNGKCAFIDYSHILQLAQTCYRRICHWALSKHIDVTRLIQMQCQAIVVHMLSTVIHNTIGRMKNNSNRYCILSCFLRICCFVINYHNTI
jgi:hypothetical protein